MYIMGGKEFDSPRQCVMIGPQRLITTARIQTRYRAYKTNIITSYNISSKRRQQGKFMGISESRFLSIFLRSSFGTRFVDRPWGSIQAQTHLPTNHGNTIWRHEDQPIPTVRSSQAFLPRWHGLPFQRRFNQSFRIDDAVTEPMIEVKTNAVGRPRVPTFGVRDVLVP